MNRMNGIPVVGFAAYSGCGKTTLIERLIACLHGRGVRVAAVKHDGHRFEIDHEGKDSWRFSRAGAEVSLIASPERTALVEDRPRSFCGLLSMIRDVDLILVEGFKNESFTQIGLLRRASGRPLPDDPGRYAAIVTDDPALRAGVPVFGFDDIEKIAEFIMENKDDFTHFNEEGRAKMVDVGGKPATRRTAAAGARVLVNRETLALIRSGGVKKGDVLTVAQIAGIMGAKQTSALIPLCHPIPFDGADLSVTLNEERCSVDIIATVSCFGQTGVEMEALTAASAAALTVYDMCKSVQRDMVVTDVRLLQKTGGVHGGYSRREEP